MERSGKELLIASRQYAQDYPATSWWHFISTLVVLTSLCVVASSNASWYACLLASGLAGLVMVRLFILYHDFQHGAILRNSIFARWMMNAYGMLIMSPPAMWKHSHDDHHKNNCKTFGAEVGAFPVMTTDAYAGATYSRRLGYRIIRNPLIIAFGYVTSFFWNKSLKQFLKDPVGNRNAGISILLHFSVLSLVGWYSVQALVLGLFVPIFIGCGIGTYLFYAQHNFPGMKRKEGEEWDYVYAALASSSFMKMSPVMHWFTGNIGYHHVHHLNSKIPFYRLPETMAELQELQNPVSTSLNPLDVFRCLRLKLWDPIGERLLTFREARTLSRLQSSSSAPL